jgi:hypothetical protein
MQTEEKDPDSGIQNLLREEHTFLFLHGAKDFYNAPCTIYSTAKTVGDRDLQHADGIALKTFEILQYFQPEIWWIENSIGGMLKDRSLMKDIPYIDVDYCQFADWGYQKPTRLWCCRKISEMPHKICDHRPVGTSLQHGTAACNIASA